jgi:hypothetical protein
MIQDAEAIDGQNHNILYCQGILARKLTEPGHRLGPDEAELYRFEVPEGAPSNGRIIVL